MIRPEPITLKLSQVLELFQACQGFEGYNKMIKGGDDSVTVPFDLDGLTRVALGMNVRALRSIAQAHGEAVDGLRKAHLPDGFDPKTASPEDRAARIAAAQLFNEEVKKLADAEVEVKLRRVKIDDLKLDKNPISPNQIALLEPILDEGDDA
jgi:hypothetical protein